MSSASVIRLGAVVSPCFMSNVHGRIDAPEDKEEGEEEGKKEGEGSGEEGKMGRRGRG